MTINGNGRQFLTTDHQTMVRLLSDILIDEVAHDPVSGGKEVAPRLKKLRDAIWPERQDAAMVLGSDAARNKREKVFAEVEKDLSPEQRSKLFEAYAQMGYLNEIAGAAVKYNLFEQFRAEGKPIPKGIKEYVDGWSEGQNGSPPIDVKTAVDRLHQPVFEVVMTQHPTNINSLQSVKAQRSLLIALEGKGSRDKRQIDAQMVRDAVRAYHKTPMLHHVKGVDTPFTVRDEGENVLNYLRNIADTLPSLYDRYDHSLREAYREKLQFYDPLDLKLNIRFTSWGSSGDKDGNNNVTAETTLEAIARHTHDVAELYLKDLQKIGQGSHLDEWKQKLAEYQRNAHELLVHAKSLTDRNEKRRNGGQDGMSEVPDQEFDRISRQLKKLREGFDLTAFEKALVDVYQKLWHDKEPDRDEADRLLGLIRKVRTFGKDFAKIEYREKASEYSRVVGALVPEYEEMKPAKRIEKLQELLAEGSNAPQRLLEQNRERLTEEGALRKYDKDDPLPIAYHTLKRMELARDFPDMIRNNVLAECGQTSHDNPTPAEIVTQAHANLLEALFVQRMAARDKARPLLGVVPLFEEPDTLGNIKAIMKAAYDDPVYLAHLDALANDRHDGKRVQETQIAHSDTGRRAGHAAARGFIHEAHPDLRQLNDEYGIVTRFFEGGSISDVLRNGGRAMSATVNAFGLHDFAKFTFQGGDLTNYFNSPSGIERLFTRNIAESANRFEAGEDGEWRLKRRVNGRMENLFDAVAVFALKRTYPDYREHDFSNDTMGLVLDGLDYHGEKDAGASWGSRAAARGQQAGSNGKPRVDIHSTRTIPFSEGWQHGGIVPSWAGSKNLQSYLDRAAQVAVSVIEGKGRALADETQEEKAFRTKFGELLVRLRAEASGQGREDPGGEFLSRLGPIEGKRLSAHQIQAFYKHSAAFRDVADHDAYCVAKTEKAELEKLKAGVPADQPELAGYIDHLTASLDAGAKRAFAALTGKDLPPRNERGDMARYALPALESDFLRKDAFRHFLLHERDGLAKEMEALRQKERDGALSPEDKTAMTRIGRDRSILHAAGDAEMHGRTPADDPAYAKHLEECARTRRWQSDAGLMSAI